ncbi:MAG: right-handed parallel beta-helix repeat-containing protein [Myxococcota bacterium]
MAVPDDSSAYVSMGAGIDATTATRIGISTSMSLVVDAGGVASGTLAIIESDGDPLTLSLETVALSAAEAAAIETGASFVLDVTVDVESGTAAATVDVAGFPTRSTPTLALTLASPTDRVDGLAQVLGTSDLTGAPSSVEFESFEVFRIFDFTTSFTVDTLIDATDATIGDALCDIGTGACSLRAAIQESNAIAGPGEIHLPSGLYVLGLVGTDEDATATGDLDVLDDLVLRGGGRDSTVVDAAGLDRVFELPPTARSVLALLHDLEITGGDATTATSFSGGGIRSTGHLVMERCVVSGSDANRAGGILALGPLQVEDCIVRGNRVGDLGFVPVGAGGIEVRSIGGPAWATIRSTAVIESDGVNASGIVFVDADPSKIENSTISDNRGDQLEVVDSDVEVVHSTLVARTENALAVQLLAGSHPSHFAAAPSTACPPATSRSPSLRSRPSWAPTRAATRAAGSWVGARDPPRPFDTGPDRQHDRSGTGARRPARRHRGARGLPDLRPGRRLPPTRRRSRRPRRLRHRRDRSA